MVADWTLEEKYKGIIQPIRDLAANWDIDISSILQCYLVELEDIDASLNSEKCLNFAEAALLLQGSTTVYSKKVEYLHSLVFRVLESVTLSNSSPQENETVSK